MAIHRLSRGGTKTIHSAVEDLFENLKLRTLGPGAVKGKRLYVGFRRDLSLPGIFETAAREEGHRPDLDLLDSLARVAGNYIDATKERAKAKVSNAIDSWLREQSTAKAPASKDDMREKLREHLDRVWTEMTTAVETILDTEATGARNVSLMDGIVKMNAARGIDDPLVYFIVVKDNVTCEECIRLHLLEDKKTPRVWKLSEVGHGYHKRGDENPKINGLHPHCRCTMVTLLPGFGFRKGSLGFIAPGWDEFEHQRGLDKGEAEPCACGHASDDHDDLGCLDSVYRGIDPGTEGHCECSRPWKLEPLAMGERDAGLTATLHQVLPQSDDLRRKPYKGNPNSHAGHCYVASEALYHLLGGRAAGWVPQFIHHEGHPHWYLRNDRTGDIADPTASQFETPVPYKFGRGNGFLTKEPSARAQKMIDRMKDKAGEVLATS